MCALRRTYSVEDISGLQLEEAVRECTADGGLGEGYDSGLGEAGGARGVDEDGHVLILVLGAIRVGIPAGLSRGDFGMHLWREDDAPNVRNSGTNFVVDIGGNEGVNEHKPCGGRIDAVREGLAGQVVVDEGGFGADGPEAKPAEDEDIRVLTVERDDVLGLDALGLPQPSTVLEDLLVDLTVGPGLVLEQDEGPFGGGLVLGMTLEGLETFAPSIVTS